MKTRSMKIHITQASEQSVVVEAETTANGKTWLVKATKESDFLPWETFEVGEKRTGSRLDPHSEAFAMIRDAVTEADYRETLGLTEKVNLPYGDLMRDPFSLETRAFLSRLIEVLSEVKDERVQDISNAQVPIERIVATLGAEAIEDVIKMVRAIYQAYAKDPHLLGDAISARRMDEAQGKTEL